MEYLENKFFLLAFTFGVFFLSRVLQKKTGWVVLNPILLTIAVVDSVFEIYRHQL